jgi:DnaJ-class molecular chaperone
MEGSFISQSYERDEDWLMTCPECNGQGTIGTGDNRKRCSKCNGAGRIKR